MCASIPCANLCGQKINFNMPRSFSCYIYLFFFLLFKTLKADNSQINSNPDLVRQYFLYPVHFKQLLIKYALIFVKMCLYLHMCIYHFHFKLAIQRSYYIGLLSAYQIHVNNNSIQTNKNFQRGESLLHKNYNEM